MTVAVKITLAASGIFLLIGMIGGVLKYRSIMKSPDNKSPRYIDLAHRAPFLYSGAAFVMAELLKYSPYSEPVQLVIAGIPLFFFTLAIAQYFKLGIENKITNQFSERNFQTTWGMVILKIGQLGGVGAIVWGFISSQLIR